MNTTTKLKEHTMNGHANNGFMKTLDDLVSKKPSEIIIDDLLWKYLLRSVARGKNCMLTGPTGCGKTVIATSLQDMFPDREFIPFNMGATQDPRGFLIGNTHFNKTDGTFFDKSDFIKAIETENSIILLDEFTRAHPEAFNILMSVLDPVQRYLRIDESSGIKTINVAKGVTFIGTANVGIEYLHTKEQIGRAMRDRWTVLELPYLDLQNEQKLLRMKFPTVSDSDINQVATICQLIRQDVESIESLLSTSVSTRTAMNMTELLSDGFTLKEAIDLELLPMFSSVGGVDSERLYLLNLLQKIIVA